jgi:hypothetical protein
MITFFIYDDDNRRGITSNKGKHATALGEEEKRKGEKKRAKGCSKNDNIEGSSSSGEEAKKKKKHIRRKGGDKCSDEKKHGESTKESRKEIKRDFRIRRHDDDGPDGRNGHGRRWSCGQWFRRG